MGPRDKTVQGWRRRALTIRPSCYRHGGLQRDCGRDHEAAAHLADDFLPAHHPAEMRTRPRTRDPRVFGDRRLRLDGPRPRTLLLCHTFLFRGDQSSARGFLPIFIQHRRSGEYMRRVNLSALVPPARPFRLPGSKLAHGVERQRLGPCTGGSRIEAGGRTEAGRPSLSLGRSIASSSRTQAQTRVLGRLRVGLDICWQEKQRHLAWWLGRVDWNWSLPHFRMRCVLSTPGLCRRKPPRAPASMSWRGVACPARGQKLWRRGGLEAGETWFNKTGRSVLPPPSSMLSSPRPCPRRPAVAHRATGGSRACRQSCRGRALWWRYTRKGSSL